MILFYTYRFSLLYEKKGREKDGLFRKGKRDF